MEANFVVLFDYCTSEIIKIKLSEREQIKAESFDDFEDYLKTLEEQYDFKLKDCCWISCNYLRERNYF